MAEPGVARSVSVRRVLSDDIFHEVDEEVRREQLKKLWERYQNLVYAAATLILVGVGGYEAYRYWENEKATEASGAFEAASALAEQGKHAEAEAAFAKVAGEGTAGYRILARMREASELASTDAASAVRIYDAIAAGGSAGPSMQDLAALRAGVLLLNSGSLDEARKRLEPLTAAGRSYRNSAREYLAFAAWQAGDAARARSWLDMIVGDPGYEKLPLQGRRRIEMLLALVAAEPKT